MFKKENETSLKAALDLAKERDDGFYGSQTYANAVARYEECRNAYYCKHSTKAPIWKSQLYFPVFFMACKAFEASIKQTIQEPIANINFRGKNTYRPELNEKEKILNADIKDDLYISGFEHTLFDMYWFNQTFGVSVGRETMVSERSLIKNKSVTVDRFGNKNVGTNESVKISEHTDTDKIHSLNFAHALNRGEFYESPWASVRYELSISDLYLLQNHPLANKAGIKHILNQIRDKKTSGWSSGPKEYYVDCNDYKNGNQDTIIATEYSGNFGYKGNMDDNRLYWGVYSQQHNVWILVGPSPYKRHPFWKMRCYGDPFGPYGPGPNGLLIPFNVLRNTLFNQYLDFTNASLKYLYQTYSPYIQGGLRSLIDGLPGGIVEAIDEEAWRSGELIKPIRKESGGIPGMSDTFSIIEKSEIEYSVASSRKRSVEGVTKTATGEMQMAEQQDAAIESIVRNMDHGLVDAMHQKISNRMNMITEEQRVVIDSDSGEAPEVLYFPFELGGDAFDITVDRKSPTAESNKYMAFLGKVAEGMQLVQNSSGMLNPQAIMEIYDEVGRKIGLDKVDRVWQQQQGMPVQIPGQQQPQAGGGPEMGQAQPPQPVMAPGSPAPIAQGAGNAMALS